MSRIKTKIPRTLLGTGVSYKGKQVLVAYRNLLDTTPSASCREDSGKGINPVCLLPIIYKERSEGTSPPGLSYFCRPPLAYHGYCSILVENVWN